MSGAGKDYGHFSGHVRSIFGRVAVVEILDSAVLTRGARVDVAKRDFARQSFRTALGPGDYVEGRVEENPKNAAQPYRLRYVTKII